jgi:hypothetical protein
MKGLPLGLQTFEEIRIRKLYYQDKTKYIFDLLKTQNYTFLSRPRRFGKSLLLSTIRSIYEGRKDLFEGLWIENQWDWTAVHPVVHIGFSSIDYQNFGLENAINNELDKVANDYNISLTEIGYVRKFKELLAKLKKEKGNVVLLIDEYDKPIIDYIGKRFEQADVNRNILKSFYSIIKDSDANLEFMLITGVSKFIKVSIFSELNNLTDLTLHRRYVALTGITQEELEISFEEEIKELAIYDGRTVAEQKIKIKEWYNGYSWDGKTFVYNPYSLLSYFDSWEFRNYWFETGTPTFLLDIMQERQRIKVEKIELGYAALSAFDIKRLEIYPLLFQTGYLTIKEKVQNGFYILDYPNKEVRQSMLEYLIGHLRHEEYALSTPMVVHLQRAFDANDLERVIRLIKSIFKNIPNQIFKADGEFYYHSLVYLVFFYLGQYIESEVNTNDGRLDAVVKTSNHIYILEFKFNESAAAALEQIKIKGYAEKYYADERQKVLVGINFSHELKTVESWLTEVFE